MAQHGGKRKGAGRKPGSIGKKRKEMIERAESGGELPLDYMLRVMRDESTDNQRRDEMAKSAAPYLHSKMPTAVVTPQRTETKTEAEDEEILALYAAGLHAESDEE